MSRIVFAFEWLPSYRVTFLQLVKKRLEDFGHEVTIYHGLPPRQLASRNTSSSSKYTILRPNRSLHIRGLELTYQPVAKELARADFVIVQHEASLVVNWLLATQVLRPRQGWALWGHGQHFNPLQASRLAGAIKDSMARKCDWYFAYTETSAQLAIEAGADSERITVVRNTTHADSAENASNEIVAFCDGLRARDAVALVMISSLDSWKRLDFLLTSLDAIRSLEPRFEFIFIGDGPGRAEVKAFADERKWVHSFGSLFGSDKAAIGSEAVLTLHPGLVGLHVVDSFRNQAPMVTTELAYHSHELEYLVDGVNGIVLPEDTTPSEYADAVVSLLHDPERLATLVAGCTDSALDLAVERSAERFVEGVLSAIGTAPESRRDQ